MSVLAIANNYKNSMNRTLTDAVERWSLPSPGFIKLNVDAAFHVDIGAGDTVAVLRDVRGNFIAAQCLYIERGTDVVTMEATIMRDGLILANSLGFRNVEAESDSIQVINSCSSQTRWWDAATAIFAECVNMSTSIGKVKFKYCPRMTNGVAHEIAKFSFLNKNSVSWIDRKSVV